MTITSASGGRDDPYRIDICRTERWFMIDSLSAGPRDQSSHPSARLGNPCYDKNAMSDRVICDICGTTVAPHAHFIVRMDIFADPSIPAMSTEDLQEMNAEETFNDLMKQMQGMSADELQDGVHRRFEYKLCPVCHRHFLSNPLGVPRKRKTSEN